MTNVKSWNNIFFGIVEDPTVAVSTGHVTYQGYSRAAITWADVSIPLRLKLKTLSYL